MSDKEIVKELLEDVKSCATFRQIVGRAVEKGEEEKLGFLIKNPIFVKAILETKRQF